MKSFKSTGILVLLVALVVGYAYFFEYRGKIDKEAQETLAKKIVPFSLDDISEFTIKTSNAESVFKKVTDGSVAKWYMEKPHKDVASFAAVQGFLSQFGSEAYEEVAAEGPSIDYSIYGLSDNSNSITFVKGDGSESFKIEVGTAVALAGKKYLRLNGQDKVLIAGYFWESQFQKGIAELREKNLIPPDFEISAIEIKNKIATGIDHLKFDKVDGKWAIKDLVTKDPDQKTVDDLYYQVKNMRASQILKNGKSLSDLKNYSLDDPDIKIKVSGKDNKDLEILFSKNITGQIYATTSDRDVIFSLNPPAVLPFKKTHDDYRDKKKPLSFDLSQVQQIDYRSDLSSFKLKKEENSWKSIEKIEGKEIDNSKVVDILSKLSSMKAKKYFDQEIEYQKSGMIELKLKTSKGDEILDLKWSPKPMDDVFVAKSNLSEKTFGLSMQDMGSLPFDAVLIDPPKEKTPDEGKEVK